MNKRNILIIIISILLIVLIAVGIVLYTSYAKENGLSGKEMFDDNPSEGVNLVPGTQEDVIEEIKAFYTESPNSTVTFIKEEDECWYFNDSEGNDYMYCFSNPEVIKLEKKPS